MDAVKSLLRFPQQAFYGLDPCCGEGQAVERLLENTSGVSCGVELDAHRALEAKSRLNKILYGAWESSVVQHDAFSVCFNNPPYDDDMKMEGVFTRAKRKEWLWIKDIHQHLLPGAVMVYIIQQERYDQSICRSLATHYDQIRVWRFPDEEFKAFGQTVLIGIRKDKSARNYKLEQELLQIPQLDLEPLLPHDAPLYEVPAAKDELHIFRPRVIRPEDVDQEVAYSPLYYRVKDILNSSIVEINAEHPPMPLNPTHKAIFLVAGCMNGPVGEGDNLHLLKGSERIDVENETEELPDGQIVVSSRETRVPQLVVVDPSGTIIDLM